MLLHSVGSDILFFVNTFADGSSSTDSFKTAIVITAGGIISAGFAALAIIVPKHRDSSAPVTAPRAVEDDPLVRELRRQMDEKDNEAAERETIIAGQAAMVERLRTFCWNNGLDPIKFRKMRQGETRETSIS